MSIVQFNLENLHLVDLGRVAAAFQKLVAHAVKDCVDRPDDDRGRTVTMELELCPVKEVVDNVITCEGAKGRFKMKCKLPQLETKVLDFGVKQNGILYFSEECPDNHRQTALPFDDDRE